jgi:hypothetical protein
MLGVRAALPYRACIDRERIILKLCKTNQKQKLLYAERMLFLISFLPQSSDVSNRLQITTCSENNNAKITLLPKHPVPENTVRISSAQHSQLCTG